MISRTILLFVLALAACSRSAEAPPAAKALNCEAHEGGKVSASNVWMREQADKGAMSAAYFTLCNGGMTPVTLRGVSSFLAGRAEMHETRRDASGVVSMAPMPSLTLLPGEEVRFEPGGKHVMLMNLAEPITDGALAKLSLRFDDGMSLTVDADIKSNAEAASAP